VLSLGNITVMLDSVSNWSNSSDQDIELSLINEGDVVIDSIRDSDFTGNELMGAFSVMNNLYQSARRKARGVEDALDRLLGELEDSEP
jgi:hypothetical protein